MSCRSLLLALAGSLALAACGKTMPGTSGINDPCLQHADCSLPLVCRDGRCGPDSGEQCKPASLRCSSTCKTEKGEDGKDVLRCLTDTLEKCAESGDRWEPVQADFEGQKVSACPTGCSNNAAGSGECNPQECKPFQTSCRRPAGATSGPGQLMLCNSNGSALTDVQTCSAGCLDAEGATPARCAAPVCASGETRCKAGSEAAVETCNATNSGWTEQACQTGEICLAGACLPAVCDVGEQRCDGPARQECLPTRSGWKVLEVCDWGCAMDGAAAKCEQRICEPFATRCNATDSGKVQTCNARGTAWDDAPCGTQASPAVCVAGRCLPKVCSVQRTGTEITERQQRCLGNARLQCNDSETDFVPVPGDSAVCPYGCRETTARTGLKEAACVTATCDTDDLRCNGSALEACSAGQTAWNFVTWCPGGCQQSGTTASCKATACEPLARRCDTAATAVELCRADGSGWDRTQSCAQGCSAGVCLTHDESCTEGEVRCSGADVQKCVRMANNATIWRFEQRCLGQCVSGGCLGDEGACGCAGGANGTQDCSPGDGSPRQAVTVRSFLGTEKVQCIKESTVLLFTDPIADTAGRVVPDGTLVTWAHDGEDSLFASTDANPDLPGLQRPTVGGRARVLVHAPDNCTADRTLVVTASLGSACGGTGKIGFTPPPPANPPAGTNPPPRTIFVSEDFSTDQYLARSATTATWDRTRGEAWAAPAFDDGNGADGDLAVTNSTLDLWTSGYGRGYLVTAVGEDAVSLETYQPLLGAGDEVLLITAHDSDAGAAPTTVGTWELKRVAYVAAGEVTFTEPVRQTTYGSPATAKIYLQRVPNFGNVTIGASGKLTTQAFSTAGTGSGVIAFRSKAHDCGKGPCGLTVEAGGSVTADRLGLPNGTAQPAASLPNLGRLLLGGGSGGNAGGGIIFVHATRVTSGFDGAVGAAGLLTAASTTGDGGTILVAAATFTHKGTTGAPVARYITCTAASLTKTPAAALAGTANTRFQVANASYRHLSLVNLTVEVNDGTGWKAVTNPADGAPNYTVDAIQGIVTFAKSQQTGAGVAYQVQVGGSYFPAATCGQTRIDYGSASIELTTAPALHGTASPTAWVGAGGAFVVQTVTAYAEPEGSSKLMRDMDVLGVIGGQGAVAAGLTSLPAIKSMLKLELSADDGLTWGTSPDGHLDLNYCLNPGSEPPCRGAELRWRASMTPATDEPLHLLGLTLRAHLL